jgi:AmmeMemoRadiSam system protein B
MRVRQPVVAGRFYPADEASCVKAIEQHLPSQPAEGVPDHIVAGIVPHAGWVFSGPTAAKVFMALKSRVSPQTIVLISAMHSWGGTQPAVFSSGAWASPLGQVKVDEDLAQTLLEAGKGTLVDSPDAHSGEHSAEVQIPFIQYLFPNTQILPILAPADNKVIPTGPIIASAARAADRQIAVIGSTDLTHYGTNYYGFAPAGSGEPALEWVRENDNRVVKLMIQMRAEDVIQETAANRNACGGGAIAATLSTARALGATEGVLLEYTTSYDVMPQGVATDFVGYAGLVLGHS